MGVHARPDMLQGFVAPEGLWCVEMQQTRLIDTLIECVPDVLRQSLHLKSKGQGLDDSTGDFWYAL